MDKSGRYSTGQPTVDYFQRWPQKLRLNMTLAYYGWDNDEIMTMSAAQYREWIKSLSVPLHIVVINYMFVADRQFEQPFDL
jgi:hypothetical protein